MTKEDILQIIDQNRDILTPENYERLLKNADILTDDEKEKIANYLKTARELLAIQEEFLKTQNSNLKSFKNEAAGIQREFKEEMVKAGHEAEKQEKQAESDEADQLITNL